MVHALVRIASRKPADEQTGAFGAIPLSHAGFVLSVAEEKSATGYTGLSNQGATCYLNSLIQTLFFLPQVRAKVYAWQFDAALHGEEAQCQPQQLLLLFASLQLSARAAVPTKPLTASFGWGGSEAFEQQDVQEFYQMFVERLEEGMGEGTLGELFRGTVKSYVKCDEIAYESWREEPFADVSLPLQEPTTLLEALRRNSQSEILTGSNRLKCEDGVLRDAVRGSYLASLPAVLFVHLQRFAWDPETENRVKVFHKVEYPLSLGADEVQQILQAGRPAGVELDDGAQDVGVYDLVSVLVHIGGTYGGHYYAYIKPPGTQAGFCEFNDATVSPVSDDKVLAACGCDASLGNVKRQKAPTAYMLVYLRRSAPLPPPDSLLVPADARAAVDRDNAEVHAAREEWERRKQELPVVLLCNGEEHAVTLNRSDTVSLALTKLRGAMPTPPPPSACRLWLWDPTLLIPSVPLMDEASLMSSVAPPPSSSSKLELFLDAAEEEADRLVSVGADGVMLRIVTFDAATDAFASPRFVSLASSASSVSVTALAEILARKCKAPLSQQGWVLIQEGCPVLFRPVTLSDQPISALALAHGSTLHLESLPPTTTSPPPEPPTSKALQKLESLWFGITLTISPPPSIPTPNFTRRVDRRWSVRKVKEEAAAGLSLDPSKLVVFVRAGKEVKDLDQSLEAAGVCDGDTLGLEDGTPCKPGEVRVRVDEFRLHSYSLHTLISDLIFTPALPQSSLLSLIISTAALPPTTLLRLRLLAGPRVGAIVRDEPSQPLSAAFPALNDTSIIVVERLPPSTPVANVVPAPGAVAIVAKRFQSGGPGGDCEGEVSAGVEVCLTGAMSVGAALRAVSAALGMAAGGDGIGHLLVLRPPPGCPLAPNVVAVMEWEDPLQEAKEDDAVEGAWQAKEGELLLVRDRREKLPAAATTAEKEKGVSIARQHPPPPPPW